MEVQQQIAFDIAESKIGSTMRVIIDAIDGPNYIGRTEFDSPEVDCNVLIDRNNKYLRLGGIYNVEITDVCDFDLIGRVVE